MVKTCVELLDNDGFNNLKADDRFIQYVKAGNLTAEKYKYYLVTADPANNTVACKDKVGNDVNVAFAAGTIFKISTEADPAGDAANPTNAGDDAANAAAAERERLQQALTDATAARDAATAARDAAQAAFDDAAAAGGGKRRKSAKKGRKPSKKGRKSAKRGRRGKGSRRNKK